MADYVEVAEVVKIAGPGADADRAQVAVTAASDWIDARLGVVDRLDPVPARVHQLALNAALRFYHDPEAPYGVIAGTGDVPMYMRSIATDLEPLLLGLRVGFGIA